MSTRCDTLEFDIFSSVYVRRVCVVFNAHPGDKSGGRKTIKIFVTPRACLVGGVVLRGGVLSSVLYGMC